MNEAPLGPTTTSPAGWLAEQDGELLRLFDLSLQMLCVAGMDGYFKRLNPAFEATLGYTREEILARPFLDFVHPDDRENTGAEVRRLREGIPTIRFENRYRRQDGAYRWFAWTCAPDRERQLLYATALDITDRKEAELLCRGVLEAAPDAMIICDGEGRITLVNRVAEQLFGYTRQELVGETLQRLLPERLRDRHLEHLASFRAAPHVRPMGAGRELCGLRQDGTEFPAEISLGPLRTEQGLLVISAIRDITERKRIERSLREQEAQLLAAQEIQQRLLPEAPPSLSGFDIYGVCHPAAFAAGDHFDYLCMPNGRIGFVVSDVAGHGIGPALLMASTHAHMCAQTETGAAVDEILSRVNRFLVTQTAPDLFVTLLLVCLDPHARALTYTSAGHPTAFVLDGQGAVKHALPSTAVPLGVLPDAAFPSGPLVSLETGDLVLLFTDGLIEARSSETSSFGEARVLDLVRRHRGQPARRITELLYDAVQAFCAGGQLSDDATVVIIKVQEPAVPGERLA